MNYCPIFLAHEDEIAQQVAIVGMLLRSVNKLIRNSKYDDKYVHTKIQEFSEAGLEAVHTIEQKIQQARSLGPCTLLTEEENDAG